MSDDFDFDLTVCIAHGSFIPCRKGGEHRYTDNPFWVKAVGDYHGSDIKGLTWEPAWPSEPAACSHACPGDNCAPGHCCEDCVADDHINIRRQERILDDGCAACNGSKVYCRAVAWVIGGETKCCDSCSHDDAP